MGHIADCRGQSHYSDVIIGTMTSQITSVSNVYSTICSGVDQIEHQSSASLAFVVGIPSTKASNAENASIWWRHHVSGLCRIPHRNTYEIYYSERCNFPNVLKAAQEIIGKIFHFSSSHQCDQPYPPNCLSEMSLIISPSFVQHYSTPYSDLEDITWKKNEPYLSVIDMSVRKFIYQMILVWFDVDLKYQ